MADENMTVQEAQQLLDIHRHQRSEQAGAAIRAVLEQYTCDLVAVPQITADGRVVADVRVVAR